MNVLQVSRVDRVYVEVDVTAALADGTPTVPAFVDVAVLPRRTWPTADTTWTTPTYANGTATLLLAGPDADPTDAVVLPSAGGDLWVRVTDVPEVQAAQAARINVY